MGKRKAPKDSSESIPNNSKSSNKKSLRGKPWNSKTDPRVISVIEDIIQSPIDDDRRFRYLELKNGVKICLISHLNQCDDQEDSDSDRDSEAECHPACRDPAIDKFNEDILGFKKPPSHRCPNKHKNKSLKTPVLPDCRDCFGLSLVAVTVGAGSHNDPVEAPGLAHLCEHMLCLGSKKFPEPSHFDEFLTKNGGSSGWNATTFGDHSVFHYDVICSALRKSLDIFVNYFIDPLVPLELVEKELSVVDSEFQAKKSVDAFRRHSLIQNLGKFDHPVCRFGWGDRRTLNLSTKALQTLLQDFFRKWYCADNMTVVIMSPTSLNELEALALNAFGRLERRGTEMLTLPEFPYATPAFRRIYRVVPTEDDDSLYISWELPAAAVYNYEAKPLEYLAAYFGNECKNGLSYYLRKRSWTTKITAEPGSSIHDKSKSSSMFYLAFSLTKLGLQNFENILEAVFSYIKYVKSIGPLKKFFREFQLISSLEFHFRPEEAFEAATHLVADMRFHEPRDILLGPEVPTKFDPKVIKDCLSLLRPERANFMISSKSFASNADQTEPCLGMKYSVQMLSRQLLDRLQNVEILSNFGPLPPNPFITTNFCPVRPKKSIQESDYSSTTTDSSCEESDSSSETESLEDAGSGSYPKCILETDRLELWHKQDSQNGNSQADFYFEFSSPLANRSARCATMMDVWIEVLNFRLKPAISAAEQALNTFKITRGSFGVQLEITGHSQKLGKIFDFFLDQFLKMNSKLTAESFLLAKEVVLRQYHNVLAFPETFYKKLARVTSSTSEWLENELHCLLRLLEFEDFQKFNKEFMSRLFVIGLAQGNVLDSQFKRMGRKAVKKLNFLPLIPGGIPDARLRQFPVGETVIRVRSFNPDDSSFFVANQYQTLDVEECKQKQACISSLLKDWMEEPAFNYLRVQKQLGYDVHIETTQTEFSIRIRGDSNKFTAGQVQKEIDNFVKIFYDENIRCLTSRKLKSYIEKLGFSDGGSAEENWAAISDGTYDFARIANEASWETRVQVDDIRDFYKKFLLPSPQCRKLCLQIVALADKEFPAETVVHPLGTPCNKDFYDTTGGIAKYPELPLTFLSPVPAQRPSSRRSSSSSQSQIRDKYVTNLGYFGRSLFLFPKKF